MKKSVEVLFWFHLFVSSFLLHVNFCLECIERSCVYFVLNRKYKALPEMRNLISLILFAKCVLFAVIFAQLDLNDHCQVARSGISGICRFYEDCPAVLTELLEQGLIPAKCGFKERREIICCPLPPTTKPSIAPQIANRTSAKSKQNVKLLTTNS